MLGHVESQFRERKGFAVRPDLVGIELGQFEQLFHQAGQALRLVPRDLEVGLFLGLAQAVRAQLQGFEKTRQRGQRRTQIVRHVGHQVTTQGLHVLQMIHLQVDAPRHLLEGARHGLDFIEAFALRHRLRVLAGEVGGSEFLHRLAQHAQFAHQEEEQQQPGDESKGQRRQKGAGAPFHDQAALQHVGYSADLLTAENGVDIALAEVIVVYGRHGKTLLSARVSRVIAHDQARCFMLEKTFDRL